MKTKNIFMLGLILALLLSASITTRGSAEGAEVPFHAYYAVYASQTPENPCVADDTWPGACNVLEFTPGGISDVMHLGQSEFSGNSIVYLPPPAPPVQKGTGTLTAANGDVLYVYYEGVVIPAAGGHANTDGWFIFTGGTGRFEGASGGGTYHVYVHLHPYPEAPNDLWFDGTLVKE